MTKLSEWGRYCLGKMIDLPNEISSEASMSIFAKWGQLTKRKKTYDKRIDIL